MRIENGLLRLEFADDTGSLRQVKDCRTGREYLSDPRGYRLVKLIAPTSEHQSRPLYSHEAGKPQIRKAAETLTITFPVFKNAGIRLQVNVRLPAGSPEAFFTLELRNDGASTVQEVWFPWMGGYVGTDADKFTHSHSPNFNPRKSFPAATHRTHSFGRHHQRMNVHPISLLPMLDVSDARGGLSYIWYAREPDAVNLVYENFARDYRELCLGWAWASRPFVKPGTTWTSSEFGIGVHQSDWHATADRLKTFRDTWAQPSGMPAPLQERIGLYHVQFRGFNGEHYHDLGELPAMARDCQKYGVRDLCLWDLPSQIYLRPDTGGFWEMPAKRLATLRRAVAATRKLGCHVGAWVNFRLITKYNRMWKELGDAVQESMYGFPLIESWPGSMNHCQWLPCALLEQDGHALCLGSDKFRRFADALVAQTLDLGFNSLYIDQASEWNSCLATHHGHRDPLEQYRKTYRWFADATRTVRARNSDAYTIGELPDLWNTQHIDLWWLWDWRFTYRSEVFRYVMPDMLAGFCIDENERDIVAKAFAMGHFFAIATRDMTGTLSDEPALAQHIARLAKLRQATAPYVAHGRFLDNRGLIAAGGDAFIFSSAAGLAVTMANSAARPQTVKVTLTPEQTGVLPASNGLLHVEGLKAVPARARRKGQRIELQVKLPAYAAGIWTLPGDRR